MVPENDDFLVMQQLKAGKESAFHTLFKKYFSVLTLYAYKILKDEDAARDVVQSVFTKVYEQRDTLEIVSPSSHFCISRFATVLSMS